MTRQLNILGAGFDAHRGIFITIEQVGLTDPNSRVYLDSSQAFRLARSLLASLHQIDENRAINQRVTSPRKAG